MAYYAYKRVRDRLIAAGWLKFDAHMKLVPANQDKYGNEVDNGYDGNLYDMAADYIDTLEEK